MNNHTINKTTTTTTTTTTNYDDNDMKAVLCASRPVSATSCRSHALSTSSRLRVRALYIPQRRVQWKQGVVLYMMLCTLLLYDTTPIHCTPLPLHPPVMNTQARPTSAGSSRGHQTPKRQLSARARLLNVQVGRKVSSPQ